MYARFKLLDGRHPWRRACRDGYVDYFARTRPGGRVAWFNFELARELDLIPDNHASRLTAALETAVLDTFALQIVNEYDLAHGFDVANDPAVRPHPYMATRYLQLQHPDKRGLHSGDGRAIWNGCVTARGKTWDISSRGTGTTRLCPGARDAREPIQTGDDSYGYSCGRAELDEMIGTVLMSEVFHRNGVPTERVLAIIDFGDGTAIGVRAAPNLIRPAHIFRYLKQARHAELRSAIEYFIERQVSNGEWSMPAHGSRRERYRRMLTYIARAYGRMAALCEQEYIFNWWAWDGDNMLGTGAIIDYGSIRQFGARHDKYRYDDVDRFSSSLAEQRFWARRIVQTFAQAVHFARTGRRRTLDSFSDDPSLRQFDAWYERELEWRLLWHVGFTPEQIDRLRGRARSEIGDLRRALSFFEQAKTSRGMQKLPDGVTHPPVFLIRTLLRELPALYVNECGARSGEMIDPQRFCEMMAASYASRRDLRLTPTRIARAENFQKCYQRLISAAGEYSSVLRQIVKRSAVINYEHRMTGNAIIRIVDDMIEHKSQLSRAELQRAIDRFITSQVLIPGEFHPITDEECRGASAYARLLRATMRELAECRETV